MISLYSGSVQCYFNSTSCNGDSTPLMTAEDCCVGAGQSYNDNSGCQICYGQ